MARQLDVVHRAGGHAVLAAGLFAMRVVGSAGTLISRVTDTLVLVVVLIKFGLGVTLGVAGMRARARQS